MANPFASFLDDFVAKPLGAMVDGVMGFPLTGPTPGPGQPSGQPPDLDRSIAALGQVESGGRYDAEFFRARISTSICE